MEASKNRKDDTMKKQTLGAAIAALRKEKGMTQLELAEQMGVTDKAVSKWERDLSCPDVSSLPKLAQILGVSVDALMHNRAAQKEEPNAVVLLICKGIALAMGIATVVLSILKQIDMYSGFGMLGIGLASLSILQFIQKDNA